MPAASAAVTETISVPSSAGASAAAEAGGRAPSRLPVLSCGARGGPPSPAETEFLALVREESALRQALARVERRKRVLMNCFCDVDGVPVESHDV
eukprot:9729876-Prorocentrum_lima.AAC.1